MSDAVLNRMKIVACPDKQDAAAEAVFEDVVDELILGISFECHREARSDKALGAKLVKNHPYCCCSNCNKMVSIRSFTSHLEKCMGLKTRRSNAKRMQPSKSH